MSTRLESLTVDAVDPVGLAWFWAVALRWTVGDVNDEVVTVVPSDGTRFHLEFVGAASAKAGKNPVDIDLTTASAQDQHDTVRRLVELGARHVDIGQHADEPHVVLADPEGNEFCVIEPGNRFLATCGRFGSITCDGSRAVGCFWSEALGWPLVWDQDDETAIRAPDGTGPFITWGPPVPAAVGRNRLRLRLTPLRPGELEAEVERLLGLGARRPAVPGGRHGVLVDPDGNEFELTVPGVAG